MEEFVQNLGRLQVYGYRKRLTEIKHSFHIINEIFNIVSSNDFTTHNKSNLKID